MSDTESSETETESTSKGSALTTTHHEADVSDEEREQLEQERQERLDPENRPVNAEVDNTGREFDVEKNDFTYAPGEEPDDVDRPQAVIGADRPEGVESDADER
jgi:hypothetical protein